MTSGWSVGRAVVGVGRAEVRRRAARHGEDRALVARLHHDDVPERQPLVAARRGGCPSSGGAASRRAAPAMPRTSSTHGPAAFTTTRARTRCAAPRERVADRRPRVRRRAAASAVTSAWFAQSAPACVRALHRVEHEARVVGQVLGEDDGAVQASRVERRLAARAPRRGSTISCRSSAGTVAMLLEGPEPDARASPASRARRSA